MNINASELAQQLTRGSERERQTAADALRRLGAVAAEPLYELLSHDNHNVRIRAAEILADIGDVRAVQPLTNALDDCFAKHESVWKQFLNALALNYKLPRWNEAAIFIAAIVNIAEREPSPELHIAIPILSRIADMVAFTYDQWAVREAAFNAAQRIEALTEQLKSLPIPAEASQSDVKELPIPTNAPTPDAATLLRPTQPEERS